MNTNTQEQVERIVNSIMSELGGIDKVDDPEMYEVLTKYFTQIIKDTEERCKNETLLELDQLWVDNHETKEKLSDAFENYLKHLTPPITNDNK